MGMGMERVAVFTALIDWASVLLQRDEMQGDPEATSEALVLIQYLRDRYSQPFSLAELEQLVQDGSETDDANLRALRRISGFRQSRVGQSSNTLVAAE